MWTNFILTENGIAVVVFIENVVVEEQVITLLEVLLFCDWERASPLQYKVNNCYLFRCKNPKLNLVLMTQSLHWNLRVHDTSKGFKHKERDY